MKFQKPKYVTGYILTIYKYSYISKRYIKASESYLKSLNMVRKVIRNHMLAFGCDFKYGLKRRKFRLYLENSLRIFISYWHTKKIEEHVVEAHNKRYMLKQSEVFHGYYD